MPSTDVDNLGAALDGRDPETLLGPILWLLTRLARDTARDASADAGNLHAILVAHLCALASHCAVPFEVRLMAGALAIEHRGPLIPR